MFRLFLNRNSISAMNAAVKSTKKPAQATTRVYSSGSAKSTGNNLFAAVPTPLDSVDTSVKKLPAVDTERYITHSLTATDDAVLQLCISILHERFKQLAKSDDPEKVSAQLLLVTMNFKNEYAAAKKMSVLFDDDSLPGVLNNMIEHFNYQSSESAIKHAIHRCMIFSCEEHNSVPMRRP